MKLDDRRAAGQIAEIVNTPNLRVKGRVRVELLDSRGRVKERQEADNYVNTVQWERYAKALQRLAWTWGLAAPLDGITLDEKGRDPRSAKRLSNDHLACWTDDTAEDPTDMFAFGDVIAWAHKWGQAAPSAKQGLVVPSLCTVGPDSAGFAWEWTTGNGNGIFQSVGWRRLYWSSASGDPLICDVALYSRRYSSTVGWSNGVLSGSSTQFLTLGTAINDMASYYDPGSGKLYQLSISASGRKLISYNVTFDVNGNYTVDAAADESAAAFAAGVGGNAIAAATFTTLGLHRIGTDWIAVGSTGSTTGRRPFVRRVTNGGSLTYSNANAATFTTESYLLDVTYDGTDIWAVGSVAAGTTSRLYKIDASDGSIISTIAVTGLPASFPTVDAAARQMTGVEWDGTFLWIKTLDGFIFNVDQTGAWAGVLVVYAQASASLTLASPQSGTTSIQSNRGPYDVDTFVPSVANNNSSVATDPWSPIASFTPTTEPVGISIAGPRLVAMDGAIWVQDATQGPANGVANVSFHAFTDEPNFASRSLLPDPIEKTVDDAMRISYTMEFT